MSNKKRHTPQKMKLTDDLPLIEEQLTHVPKFITEEEANQRAIQVTNTELMALNDFYNQQEERLDAIKLHLNSLNTAYILLEGIILTAIAASSPSAMVNTLKVLHIDTLIVFHLQEWRRAIVEYSNWIRSWNSLNPHRRIPGGGLILRSIRHDYEAFETGMNALVSTINLVLSGEERPTALAKLYLDHNAEFEELFVMMQQLAPRYGAQPNEETRRANKYIQEWCADFERRNPKAYKNTFPRELHEELKRKERDGLLTDDEKLALKRFADLPKNLRALEKEFNHIRTGRGKLTHRR